MLLLCIRKYRIAWPTQASRADINKALRGGLLIMANPVPAMAANSPSATLAKIRLGRTTFVKVVASIPVISNVMESPNAIHIISKQALVRRIKRNYNIYQQFIHSHTKYDRVFSKMRADISVSNLYTVAH